MMTSGDVVSVAIHAKTTDAPYCKYGTLIVAANFYLRQTYLCCGCRILRVAI